MIYEVMNSRRSIRKFQQEIPSRDVIERLIEAAITAPSASNKQPWRFLILTNNDTKKRLADAVRAAVNRIAAHIEPDFEKSFRAYGDYFTRFEEAPVVIIPLYRPMTLLSNMLDDDLSKQDKNGITHMENNSGLISTSLAMQNLLLMAHELGLGASGMTGPLVAQDSIRDILALPASWEVVAFVPVGFPAEAPDPKPRKSIEAVTRWLD